MTKPIIDKGRKASPRKAQLQIQIKIVRLVSIVERWAAEAYLVVAIPNTLKQEMEQMIPRYCTIITGFSAIYFMAKAESSSLPKLQRPMVQTMYWKMGRQNK